MVRAPDFSFQRSFSGARKYGEYPEIWDAFLRVIIRPALWVRCLDYAIRPWLPMCKRNYYLTDTYLPRYVVRQHKRWPKASRAWLLLTNQSEPPWVRNERHQNIHRELCPRHDISARKGVIFDRLAKTLHILASQSFSMVFL